MNYSILRYPGGKTRAVNELKKYIPDGTKEICSPFFGGGSFEFYLETIGIKVHGYDNYDLLVNFWNRVKDSSYLVYDLLPQKVSKNDFYLMQQEILIEKDLLKKAAMFYTLNRCSFSGTILSGGMSPKHPRFNMEARLRLMNFATDMSVDLLPFELSIPKHDCLIYADPPYWISQALYGNKGDMHIGFNHKLLADMLNERGNFLLSYNNSEEVKDLYHKHKFFYPEWKYGMSSDKGSKEILIMSNDMKNVQSELCSVAREKHCI